MCTIDIRIACDALHHQYAHELRCEKLEVMAMEHMEETLNNPSPKCAGYVGS